MPLKRVLLHRPGNELLNLTPDSLQRLLFDDIPYLKVAQEEKIQEEYPEVIQILCSDFKGEVISVSKVQKNNIEQNFNKNQENTIEERHKEVEEDEF